MTKKLQAQLNAIEEIIANSKNDIKNAKDSVHILIKENPDCKEEISKWYRDVCKRHKIDIFSDIRNITGEDINKHLDQF